MACRVAVSFQDGSGSVGVGTDRSSMNAAEPEVGGAGVDRVGHAGGRAVASAVVGGAQVGAALHHLATDGGGVPRVAALVAVPAAGVGDRAAGVGQLAVGLEPV